MLTSPQRKGLLTSPGKKYWDDIDEYLAGLREEYKDDPAKITKWVILFAFN